MAEDAVAVGVRRLIFLSSIGVLGHTTSGREPFSARDRPAPAGDYAVSKWEAEQELADVSRLTKIETVIVRPPLVYGFDAPGNFCRLMKLIESGVPLPFGCVRNSRSLVGIGNLVDMLVRCAWHPAATGKTFLISDG